eukprot:symbB.v1.2.002964.t1/scaffold154.1/size328988/9
MPMSYWMLVIMGFWSHGLERKSHDQPMVFDYRTDEEQVDQHHAFLWKEVLRPLPSRLQQPSPQYSFECLELQWRLTPAIFFLIQSGMACTAVWALVGCS